MDNETTSALKILNRASKTLGIKIEFENSHRYVGELVFPNGKREPFLGRNLNINPSASLELARDKGYTCYFLRKKGFRVPDGKVFFSDEWNKRIAPSKRTTLKDATSFAKKLGYPVFIKPNNLSQGALVAKVYNEKQLIQVAKEIFKLTPVLIIERPCEGNDYRLLVLGNKVISAYQRVHVSVTGDGKSTINGLLQKMRLEFKKLGRPEKEVPINDFRVDQRLKNLGLSRGHILAQGEKLQLLDNANLCNGGMGVDMTGKIHKSFEKIAVEASQALGLPFCGVDILTPDVTKPAKNQTWWIIELNGNAQLNSYVGSAKDQEKRVGKIYEKILEHLIRKHK